jgi:hypothetical protein
VENGENCVGFAANTKSKFLSLEEAWSPNYLIDANIIEVLRNN